MATAAPAQARRWSGIVPVGHSFEALIMRFGRWSDLFWVSRIYLIVAGPNPAAAVRGPKHVVKKGKTSVLDGDEAKKRLDSIERLDDRRLARSGADRAAGLHLRARLGRAAHERRRLLSARQALVGPPPRKRRQAARNAGASPARTLSRRLCHGGGDRRG
jgi:hypothetical protein